jgi:hypothetical protein
MENGIDWKRIGHELAAPLPADAVEWRPSGKTGPRQRVQLVAYISSRTVAQRLDDTIGCGNWSFTYDPLVIAEGELRVAKGTLSIYGVAKQDIGTSSNWEPSKGCISDTLKRCGVLWGIGRYLYELPVVHAQLDDSGHVSETTLAKLREGLERLAAKAA